jgi:hypothetical protein
LRTTLGQAVKAPWRVNTDLRTQIWDAWVCDGV